MCYDFVMPRNAVDYDADFVAWSEEQARLLRAREFNALDIKNIAEEIESLGRSDKRAIVNRLVVLITHLLKWQYQAKSRSKGWLGSIDEQRRRIEMLVEESPSLQPMLPALVAKAYPAARRKAARDMTVEIAALPAECPYAFDAVLRDEFYPGDNGTAAR